MTRETLSRYTQKISHWLPVILFACALYIVHNQIKAHDLSDILVTIAGHADADCLRRSSADRDQLSSFGSL